MSTKKLLIIALVSLITIIVIILGIYGIIRWQNMNKTNDVEEVDKYYYELGEMYCNLKDSNRILKCNITIEVTDENLLQKLESKKFIIHDEINKVIRNKEEKDIEGKAGQVNLQNEISKMLITIFETQDIDNIYFNELIVQ